MALMSQSEPVMEYVILAFKSISLSSADTWPTVVPMGLFSGTVKGPKFWGKETNKMLTWKIDVPQTHSTWKPLIKTTQFHQSSAKINKIKDTNTSKWFEPRRIRRIENNSNGNRPITTSFTFWRPITSRQNWPITKTLHLTLKMTTAQVIKTSVTNNSLSKDYSHPDDHTCLDKQFNKDSLLDSEDDYHSGSRNVSHQQQSYPKHYLKDKCKQAIYKIW